MTSEMTPERLAEGPKSREQLGLPREVRTCVRVEGAMWLTALKCGHWFKSQTRVEPGTNAGCVGCDSLERLTERSERQAAEIERLREVILDVVDCECPEYVVDYSDPERYHPRNMERADNPTCPAHHPEVTS